MSLNKYTYPHEIIFNQTNDILKNNYKEQIDINSNININNNNNNKAFRIKLNLGQYGKKKIIGCKNLVLILDLDLDPDEILDYQIIKSLVNRITFQINGYDIETLSGNNIIQMMINYYELEIKQIGSKIYFPLPLNLFQKGFIPYYFENLFLMFVINNQNVKYKKISIDLEIFYGELNFNQKYLINYYNNNFDKIVNYFNEQIKLLKKTHISDDLIQLLEKKPLDEYIKNNLNNLIFFGYELSELVELIPSMSKKNIWINLPRMYDKITELFFFLTNKQTGEFVTEKFFTKIEYRKNFSLDYSVSYEELIYDLGTINKKLPDGVYRIPFENINSNKLNFYEYTVNIELDNDIMIDNYNVEFYGLYDFKMNILNNNMNILKFKSNINMDKFSIFNIYH